MRFPGNKRFAFTVIDDTDVATRENVEPVYDLLYRLGMRTTKTVWPVGCPEGSRKFRTSQTLEHPGYLAFVRELEARGFEITWHGPTMESSLRPRVLEALERYRTVFGSYPRIHVNHSENADNIYWGVERFDDPVIRRVVRRISGTTAYGGHVEGSPHYWGDFCARHVEYARNLTCSNLNTASFNPSMPYRDPRRPLVPWWFSATHADSVREFTAVLHPTNQQRLEDAGGFCIVATHFGKGFSRDGVVDADFRSRLELLAARDGWFPTTGELLDWLRERRGDGTLPRGEWRTMQWTWLLDAVRHHLSFLRRSRRNPLRKLLK